MPYPDNLIQEGETVALDLRPHWWYFSRNILTGIPLLIILILRAERATPTGLEVRRRWSSGIVAIAWAVWLGLKYLQWRMTYFVVTSRRVIYRTGVLSKRGVEIPLERINNINFHQRIIDRIIGAGDLDIESAGKDGQSHFDFVRHPDGVQHEIYRQMEARNMPRGDGAAGAGGAPAPARRRRACPSRSSSSRDLRDQGHITRGRVRGRRRRSCSAGCRRAPQAITSARRRRRWRRTRRRRCRSRRGSGASPCASTSSAWLRCTSATTQPPNPAPVSRAPAAPLVDEQRRRAVSSSGVDTLVVVAQAGVALEQQWAEHGQVAARSAAAVASTRAFSVTT